MESNNQTQGLNPVDLRHKSAVKQQKCGFKHKDEDLL
jgi:hypothetical protein